MNVEEERIICKCNLNTNNNKSNTSEDDNLEEDNGNYLTYLLDNINYKIFQCFDLLSEFDNLKHNYSFYVIAGVFIVLLIIDILFFTYTIPRVRNLMLRETPTPQRVREETKKELIRIKKLKENSLVHSPPKNKRSKSVKNLTKRNIRNDIRNKTTKINSKNNLLSKRDSKRNTNLINKKIHKVKKRNTKNSISIIDDKLKSTDPFEYRKLTITPLKKRKSNKTFNIQLTNKEEEKINDDQELNELPYTRAVVLDQRNVFQVFKSFLLLKFEIINILLGREQIKIILIGEYILSLFINFFFNALLYTDEVVSNKYHNNGQLDVIVTLSLSIISNIVTSIICYYIKYSKGIQARLDQIMEIKNQKYFFRNIIQFFRFIKIKFICFFISEVIIIAACYYYIVIFCIVYTNSKVSLLINYLLSLVEGLITSAAIIIIIFVTRQVGLKCLNKNFYNLSKFVNDRF